MVCLLNLKLKQLYVKITFLYGKLEERIYMHKPEVFITQGKEDNVYLLKKLLYGLK
jgi:hypothetical protein